MGAILMIRERDTEEATEPKIMHSYEWLLGRKPVDVGDVLSGQSLWSTGESRLVPMSPLDLLNNRGQCILPGSMWSELPWQNDRQSTSWAWWTATRLPRQIRLQCLSLKLPKSLQAPSPETSQSKVSSQLISSAPKLYTRSVASKPIY